MEEPEFFPPTLQADAGALPDTPWDAMMIGAGPAGSMAAIELAARGHRVLLLDSRRFPRDKPCGDGLIADALGTLAQAGLESAARQAGHALGALSIFSASGIEFSVPGDFVTLRRSVLDALLARRAAEAGATFARATVEQVATGPEGLVCCRLADGQCCRGRYGVIATGAGGRLLPWLDLAAPAMSGVAMRCYVRSPLALDRLIVSFDRDIIPGYAWIFPLGDGEFNLGCGVVSPRPGQNFPDGGSRFNLRRNFNWFTRHFALARELMDGGRIVAPLKGAMLRCGLGAVSRVGGRLLLAGDALGATLPFTGEGIGKALQTGRRAALAIHEALAAGCPAPLAAYERWVQGELRPLYGSYAFAQRWFSRSWANDLIARRVCRSPYLRGAFAGLMTETVSPDAIFSLPALMKSFWS